MAAGNAPAFDEGKLNAFMEKVVRDMGAAMHAALIVIGDKLGLYKAMAGAGPLSSDELAKKTGTTERYVREWLNANAASGYVTYDPSTKKYEMPPEQAVAMTMIDVPGAFHIVSACFKDEAKITQAFRTGDGVGWHEHDAALFHGTERFFRPNYQQHLLSEWIPSLTGVEEKLKAGRQDRGRWLRSRRIVAVIGDGVSEVAGVWVRLSRGLGRIRAEGRSARWRAKCDF